MQSVSDDETFMKNNEMIFAPFHRRPPEKNADGKCLRAMIRRYVACANDKRNKARGEMTFQQKEKSSPWQICLLIRYRISHKLLHAKLNKLTNDNRENRCGLRVSAAGRRMIEEKFI